MRATVLLKYSSSSTAFLARSIDRVLTLYGWKEYLIFLRSEMRPLSATTKPTLAPASERDLENVFTTTRLLYFFMNGIAF